MTCPKCSQSSNDAQFCSRCGSPLERRAESLAPARQPEAREAEKEDERFSPRQKGVRQGIKLMLLSIVLIPAYLLLAALFPANDKLVESHVSDTPFEKISQAVLFTIFMCGLARLIYAYFFERGVAEESTQKRETGQLNEASGRFALPPAQSIPVSGFGAWRTNTGEVSQSVGGSQREQEEFKERE